MEDYGAKPMNGLNGHPNGHTNAHAVNGNDHKFHSLADGDTSSPDKSTLNLVLDASGLPLVPQPSDDPLDPLNWKPWLKMLVLLQISMLSALTLFNGSLVVPAFQPLSKYLHRSITQTAYIITIFIAGAGVASLVWNPISNVIGRRPLYLLSIAVSVATCAGAGASHTYPAILALRGINGLFQGICISINNATVCDMYFEHERGFYMGIYTLALITGGHIAPTIGGFIQRDISWRWCFYIPGILTGAMLLLFALTAPETLYPRNTSHQDRPYGSWMQNMLMKGMFHPRRKLRATDFIRPLQMLAYPSVLLPTAYYAVTFSYGSILFIVTSSSVFARLYHFAPYQTGLLLGIPLTVGSIVGELISGALSDRISNIRAMARGRRKSEDRLIAIIPAVILVPLGIIIEGVCIEQHLHWAGVGMGIGIASCGTQIATTIIFTYTVECYRQQSAEIGALLNFSRQMFGFCVGFYAVDLGELIGFQNAWIVFAMINLAFSLPVLLLYFKGEQWRAKMGVPEFHRDL